MKKTHLALALAAVLGLAAPALAQQDTTTQMQQPTTTMGGPTSAFTTHVPALAYTIEENRMVAVTYMDDALTLMNFAQDQLRQGNTAMATSALMGASGKLTTAYLDLYQDRSFSQRIEPMTMQVEQAMNLARTNPQRAAAVLNGLTPQVAAIFNTQVAQLGGGAGRGVEGLNLRNLPGNESQQEQPMPRQPMLEDETQEQPMR